MRTFTTMLLDLWCSWSWWLLWWWEGGRKRGKLEQKEILGMLVIIPYVLVTKENQIFNLWFGCKENFLSEAFPQLKYCNYLVDIRICDVSKERKRCRIQIWISPNCQQLSTPFQEDITRALSICTTSWGWQFIETFYSIVCIIEISIVTGYQIIVIYEI